MTEKGDEREIRGTKDSVREKNQCIERQTDKDYKVIIFFDLFGQSETCGTWITPPPLPYL